MSEITPQIVADHGLNEEEYARILNAMGARTQFGGIGYIFGDVVRALLL